MNGMTNYFLEPLKFITDTIKLTANMVLNSINSSKDMIKKMYTLLLEIINQIVKLLANILLPIQNDHLF